MKIYLDNCCYNEPFKDALGPIGMVRFIQQYDLGYGDYTKERLEEPDVSLDEIDRQLKISKNAL